MRSRWSRWNSNAGFDWVGQRRGAEEEEDECLGDMHIEMRDFELYNK